MRVLVKHIMKSPVVSLLAEQTLPFAVEIMEFRHVRHLPVIDDLGRLVGLVSHRDLLGAQASSLTPLDADGRRELESRIRVADIMHRDVWTTRADVPAAAAGRMLLRSRFGCLPVVDETGRVLGIVTDNDFLRLAVVALTDVDEAAGLAGPEAPGAELARIG